MPKPSHSERNLSKSLAQANTITIDPTANKNAPVIGLDGQAQRPPKGHKQRGAGTVIVAKAAVVTADGIVLKAHERLPTQILQEYCQREKRPAPIYEPRGPGHRHEVKLPDKKDAKYDLKFLPNDADFESVKVAKDFAALLALFDLQRSIPLENKLPVPYCDSWKAMLAAAKEAERAAKRPGRASTNSGKPIDQTNEKAESSKPRVLTAAPPDCESDLPTPALTVVPQLDATTADWLCCTCNQQNFAKLQSGILRTKCFKCGALKTPECELVASTAPISMPAHVSVTSFKLAPEEQTRTPTFGFTEPKKSNERNTGLGGTQFKMGKAPPQARLQLENKIKSNSNAENERLQAELRAMRKRQKCYWDAVMRANRPATVILSPQMRARLESVLGLDSSIGGLIGDSSILLGTEASSKATFSTVSQYIASLSNSTGLIPSDECRLEAGDQFAALKCIGTLLASQGFHEPDIVRSFSYIASAYDNVLDELAGVGTGVNIARGWEKCVLDASLEWLCVHLDNVELPKKFDARRNEGQLQIRRADTAPTSKAENTNGILSNNKLDSDELKACRLRVREYGWSAEEVDVAMSTAKPTTQSLYFPTLLMMLISATVSTARQFGGSDLMLPAMLSKNEEIREEDWLAAVRDEVDMLSSIFGDTRSVQITIEKDYCIVSVPLRLEQAIKNAPRKHFLIGQEMEPATLEMMVTNGMDYPTRPPVLLLRYAAARNAKVLLTLNLALWGKGAELAGDSLLYQIVLWLEAERGGVVDDVLCSQTCAPGTPIGISGALTRLSNGNLTLPPPPPEFKNSFDDNTTNEEKSASSGKSNGKTGKHPFWSQNSHARGPLLLSHEEAIKRAKIAPTPGSLTGQARESWLSMLQKRKKLPAWAARESFLATIAQHRGMVVTGETGCGKTTQIPQFLLEADSKCKILVCQPRRLAATGVATRVATEVACSIGETVGYMVRGDSACGPRTRLAFCTYGVLLRRLLQDPDLGGIDYVVLDEVHERGIDSDFGLGLLAAALGRNTCTFKLILMSATISTDKFASYLGLATAGAFAQQNDKMARTNSAAPVLHIPGYTFDVAEYYKNDFEDILRADSAVSRSRGEPNEEENEGGESKGGIRIGGLGRKGDLDYDLLVRCCIRLALGDGSSKGMFARATGSVLVFLPGVPEILRFCALLQEAWAGIGGRVSADTGTLKRGDRDDNPSLRIMPLHAGTPPSEQQHIFQDARPGELKIIAATNVAEASITIPDVSVVLDSCRVKETDFDPLKQMNALVLKFASKDSLRQRRGRAGRVSEGRCFRAINLHTYTNLPNHSIPEILRASLDALVLQIKSMTSANSIHSEPVAVQLSRCPDPPAAFAVSASESMLMRMQALDTEGNITPLGRHLAALPCAPRVGRLLIYGCLLNCVLPMANVAAMLSTRSPFLDARDSDQRGIQDSIKAKLAAVEGGRSDQLIIVAACAGFDRCSGAAAQRRFCQENMLSYARMQEIKQLTRDLLADLANIALIRSARDGFSADAFCNSNSKFPRIVTAAISAGLYPQVARIMRPPKRFEDVMGSALEKETKSKELKFYVPQVIQNLWSGSSTDEGRDAKMLKSDADDPHNPRTGGGDLMDADDELEVKGSIATEGMFRVFIHPSSIHFDNNSFGPSQYVMYGETRLQVVPGRENKSMIQDITEVSAFPILFFGGRLEAQYLQGTITVDGWLVFSASGKLVALIQALRRALDALLTEKLENPGVDHTGNPVLSCVYDMLNSVDGLR